MDSLWAFALSLATCVIFGLLGIIALVAHLVQGNPNREKEKPDGNGHG